MDPLHTTSWDWIKSFVAVAEQGSVLAAAQHLQTNPATVSRQIASLEKSLGLELFVRSRQGMQPTLPAMQFLEPARAMHAAMHRLSLGAAAKDAHVQGVVRISVSVTLAHFVLPELLDVFRSQHSGIHFEVTATDSVSNLSQREADIAIRHVRPDQPDLIGKLLYESSAGFYASLEWVRRHGHPRTAAEALQHDFIGVDRVGRYQELLAQHGLPLESAQFTVLSENSVTAWMLVQKGLGIGVMMEEVAQLTPDVVRVLDDIKPVRFPVWLVTHRELRTSRRIRVVFDTLATALADI